MSTIYSVSTATALRAQRQILGCWTCTEVADVPLAAVLDRLTGLAGSEADYVLSSPLGCPRCGAPIPEESLVECHRDFLASL
jgi:hypothetical protein